MHNAGRDVQASAAGGEEPGKFTEYVLQHVPAITHGVIRLDIVSLANIPKFRTPRTDPADEEKVFRFLVALC